MLVATFFTTTCMLFMTKYMVLAENGSFQTHVAPSQTLLYTQMKDINNISRKKESKTCHN